MMRIMSNESIYNQFPEEQHDEVTEIMKVYANEDWGSSKAKLFCDKYGYEFDKMIIMFSYYNEANRRNNLFFETLAGNKINP